ncbi:CHAT domain-containing protein [Oscillatoria sp. FACHB-1407]|uniref:nSTAND1 domain-containing NTPase n=1 Tax=Oscillatoria sp. FACHB-1407 TaxID=2692847 RepID=UPI0016890913|nr:CHAT domain-containing protein [Oscillatoria sp. FACHB-1407]MBD2459754.1 CHAT domain-containing protein [Oscillatoria sp. FACHB-1407]
MTALVILDFDGDLQQGVVVTLEIRLDDVLSDGSLRSVVQVRTKGKLPPNPTLDQHYQQWRSLYNNLSLLFRLGDRPNPVPSGSKANVMAACRQAATNLVTDFNQWLAVDSLRAIREQFLEKLSPGDTIRIILQSENPHLRHLPWHLWDVLQRYPNVEVALSAPAYERVAVSGRSRQHVRILAVLGNRTGIDIDADRQLLANLPDGAETCFLVEPERQQLQQCLWDAQGWDILFFAGHSASLHSGEVGYLELNQHDRISVDELTYALRKAIAQGLQLAIFNSCDGLGLANQLERLHIPHLIVMREPVPDQVAQAFLRYFLTRFSKGHPLHLAVRDAREQLQSLEDQCPCATWLPILCQNPTADPPTWAALSGQVPVSVTQATPELLSQAPSRIPPCPYRGLAAFQEADAPFFFGREMLAEKWVNLMQQRPLLAVLGASGSGKSSLVLAGLVPRLRSHSGWQIAVLRPGNHPFARLAEQLIPLLEPGLSETDQLIEGNKLAIALHQGTVSLTDVVDRILQKQSTPFQAQRVLLVVDQFEELYTLCANSEERQRFQDCLLKAVTSTEEPLGTFPSTLAIVLTLRADFLEYALAHRPFAEALQRFSPELLTPMTRSELQAVIEKPANRLGVRYAEGLTERILDAVDAAPGHLPLLEFALTLLWEKQNQGYLTHAAYEAIGGVERALTTYAEQVYGSLDTTAQRQAQRIFTQLVCPGEGTADTRRLATRSEIGAESWRLVTHLADTRLVVSRHDDTANEDIVEIAHEALIQEWQRLRQWLEDDRSFRTWQERLRGVVRQWEISQQDEGALLRGAPLVEAQHWFQERQTDLSQGERALIHASLSQRDLEQQQRDRRRRFRITALSSGFTAALLLIGIAAWQWQRAEIITSNAQLDSLSSASEELLASGKQLEALLESLRAGKQLSQLSDAHPDTYIHVVTTLQQVVYGVREYNRLIGHERSVIHASFSPDGQVIVSASDDDTVRLWRRDGTLIDTLKGHRNHVRSVSFSPNGAMFASASYDNTIRLWRRNGGAIATLNGHTDKVNSISFSPNGQWLASASADSTIRLWQLNGTEPQVYATLLGHRGWVMAVSFSPDGQLLASAGNDGVIRLWRSSDGQLLATLPRQATSIDSLSFSPDGTQLVAATKAGNVLLWQRQGNQFTLVKTLTGHTDRVWGASFSPDGQIIASASADNTVKLWRSDGTLIVTLEGHNSSVYSVNFSPDGETLISTSADNTVKLWHPNSPFLKQLQTDTNRVRDISYSPDGRLLATANELTTQLWRTTLPLVQGSPTGTPTTAEPLTINGHQERVNQLSFSPDGQLVATASDDTTVKVWTVTGELVQTLTGYAQNLLDVQFSPDGRTMAIAGEANTIQLWQRDSSGRFAAQPAQTLTGHSREITSLAFSPDGQWLASSSGDHTIRLWRSQGNGLFDSNSRQILTHTSQVTSVSFNPNGQMLASATADGNAILWRLDGTLIARLSGHRDRINSVVFSPNGRLVATASDDGRVKLWNTSGTLLKTLQQQPSALTALSFSPDGQTLASATANGAVIFWNFNLDNLMTQGCDWLSDYLRTNSLLSTSDRNVCSTFTTRY